MHETSEILRIIEEIRGKKVKKLRIVVGNLVYVEEEAIRSVWSAMVPEELKGVELEVKYEKAKILCPNCGILELERRAHYHLRPSKLPCPLCGSYAKVLSGFNVSFEILS